MKGLKSTARRLSQLSEHLVLDECQEAEVEEAAMQKRVAKFFRSLEFAFGGEGSGRDIPTFGA